MSEIELPKPTGPRYRVEIQYQPGAGIKLAGPADVLLAQKILILALNDLNDKLAKIRALASGKSNGVQTTGDMSVLEE